MKTIRVVAAIIVENGRVFATQRGYGDFKDGWEFPGGKIEAGESPEQALVREIREELDTEVRVERLLRTVEWDYPTFHLSMDCFWCQKISGKINLKEATSSKWLKKQELNSVEWSPTDLILIDKISKEMSQN